MRDGDLGDLDWEVKMNARFTTMLAALAIMVAAAGFATAGQAVNESHPVPAGAEVSVENIAGSVKVEGWSSNTVEVTGTLGNGVEELDFYVDEEDGEVSIEVEYDEDYHGRQDEPTNLMIKMPASSPLSVETVSASITVSGIDGWVDIETVSGKVHISGRPEALEIESVSGGVQVETAPSGTGIESVSGRIEIASAMGELDVENVSGTILVNGGRLGDADFETVSGSIECYAMPGDGDVDMETMSGTITLTVDPDAVASYELSTFSGSIKNDFGPEPKRTSKYTPGKELSFSTGSGGPSISLTSFSGTINLMVR
jgi:DUF4097 and DUF4098 domain-containing protein YvlB